MGPSVRLSALTAASQITTTEVGKEMPRNQAVEVQVDSWDQARSLGQRMAAAFIFRGQHNSSWPLCTRLERDVTAAGGAPANRTWAES